MKGKIEKRQRDFLYLDSIFQVQAMIGSILPIFYMAKLNISLDRYLYLDSLLFILTSIFEMPSGYISDKFGRKNILILGKTLILLSSIILLFSDDFMGGLFTIIFVAIGSSLISGNVPAILYEFYGGENDGGTFERLISNANSIAYVFISFYSIIGPLVFKASLKLILYLDIIIEALNICLTGIFLYDDRSLYQKTSLRENKRGLEQISKGKFLRTGLIFLLVSCVFATFRVGFNFYQPIYQDYEIDVGRYGIFAVAFNGLAALGAQIYKKLSPSFKDRLDLYLPLFGVVIVSSILMGLFWEKFYLFLIFIASQQLARGISGPLQSKVVNDAIPSDTNFRTSYISLFDTLSGLTCSLFIFLSGLVARGRENLTSLVLVNLGIIIIAFVLYVIIKIGEKNEQRNN